MRRSMLRACVDAGLAMSVVLLLGEGIGRLVGMGELASAVWLLAAAGVGVGTLLGGVAWRLARPPSAVELARQIEMRHPELLDALICAAELAPGAGDSPRVLERALFDRVEADTGGLDFLAAATPPPLRRGRLLGRVLALVAFALLAFGTMVFDKGRVGLATWLGWRPPGLVVLPGTVEIPVDGDVRVTARIDRWESTAIIEVVADGERLSSPMNVDDAGHSFTLYAIDAPLKYRVRTPSLRSPWYAVKPYTPAAFVSLVYTLVPPDYTFVPPSRLEALQDVAVLVGTRISLTATTNVAAQVLLDDGQRLAPLVGEGTAGATFQFEVDREVTFSLVIRDREGRETRTPPSTVAIFPDQPPTIDLLEPTDDPVIRPGEAVSLRARAVDDFGLAKLAVHLSVAGRDERSLTLHGWAPPADGEAAVRPEVDLTVEHLLSSDELGAEAGEVIVAFLTATDTRQPLPQTARSRVFFIEIRPEITPQESPGGQEKQTVEVQRLIEELRRLIRLTQDVLSSAGDRQADLALQLKTGLADLRNETVRQMEKIKAEAPAAAAAPMLAWYQRGLDEIDTARALAVGDSFQASISPQVRALTIFTQLAQELMKNSSSSQDSESGESGQGQPQDGSPPERSPPISLSELNRLLQEARDGLKALADRQGAMARQLEAAAPRQPPANERSELAEAQRQLARRAKELAAALGDLPVVKPLQDGISRATGSMAEAEGEAGSGSLAAAGRHGRRAQRDLLESSEMADQLMRELARRQVSELAKQAQALADGQGKLAEYAQQAGKSDDAGSQREVGEALRRAQKRIEERLAEVEARAGQLAGDFEQPYPEASRAMVEALAGSAERNPQGKSGRASNAVLYGRFDRAASLQREVAADLGRLAQELYLAADKLPRLSRDELLRALGDMQAAAAQARSGAQQGDAEAVRQAIERSSERATELGMQLNDLQLMSTAANLGGLLGDGTSVEAQAGLVAGQYLHGIMTILRRQLLATEVESKQELSRRQTNPPAKYRNLVEDYFKALSEGE